MPVRTANWTSAAPSAKGTCALVNGEIAEDLTYYYAVSEQTPSSVSLGVLMNRDNTVAQAGGFMLQLMPGASDEMAAALEQKVLSAPSVTTWLSEGLTAEDWWAWAATSCWT